MHESPIPSFYLFRALLETQADNIMGDKNWTFEDLNKSAPDLLNLILSVDEQISDALAARATS